MKDLTRMEPIGPSMKIAQNREYKRAKIFPATEAGRFSSFLFDTVYDSDLDKDFCMALYHSRIVEVTRIEKIDIAAALPISMDILAKR
jgi:hypothetical protein